MKPDDLVTEAQSRRFPDGAYVRDCFGRRWTLIRPTGVGATRRWQHRRGAQVYTHALFAFYGPIYLVSLPKPSGDGS